MWAPKGVSVWPSQINELFYVGDEDVKFTHGFVDSFISELCRQIINNYIPISVSSLIRHEPGALMLYLKLSWA